MIDKEIWAEALNLAKDQLRHGKVHFSELEVVTKSIYEKLTALSAGPIIDIQPEILPRLEEAKHIKTKKGVVCALCGKEFKSLTKKHLQMHGMTREEYMERFGVSKKDMSIASGRKTPTGDDNPLKKMHMIMKEFNVKRGDVTKFIKESGYDDLKSLMELEKTKEIGLIDLLKQKPDLQIKQDNGGAEPVKENSAE